MKKKENDEEGAIAKRERERKRARESEEAQWVKRSENERSSLGSLKGERERQGGESLRQNVAENANADTVMLLLA